MLALVWRFARAIYLVAFVLAVSSAGSIPAPAWTGILRDALGNPVPHATVLLHAISGTLDYSSETSQRGEFLFAGVAAGSYELKVTSAGKTWKAPDALVVKDAALTFDLALSAQDLTVRVVTAASSASAQASGGEHLSKEEVSSLPLNERDFSKLLLLAAGTMTDTNGAANFTQQFAVNGQRGVASVFAIDGADTTDPELGGATFANFNVDAIQEVQSSSGVMPADIGHGAASFTNVVSKSGANQIHGSAFEFIRNAAFDARNFFDHKTDIDPRRIPPFARNEFGVTNGGPVVLPGIYDGRGKTFYFGEYQGFRQVLGTTQVFPVPTAAERQGIDTTTFPGDTLTVPVNPAIASLLARYPLPNDPAGPYGARTYAASSKIVTNTDQFSARVDHRLSEKATLFTRFSLNQVNGPTTNPDQTAIDPTFGIKFFDHQRNAAVRYSRTISPHLTSSTAFGYIRSTPFFPTDNHTDPAIAYGDGLFQGFNSGDGSIYGSFGNVYQFKQDMAYTRGSHNFKWGAEIRWNKDATIFGTNPNGLYTFGGGTAYSPVLIPSASGLHDIHPGDALPDALTGLLTATPYSYTVSATVALTPTGKRFDEAAVRREAYNFYFLDSWKATSRLSVSYGLRYDLNSRIKEAQHRTSIAEPVDSSGNPTSFLTPGAKEIFLYNPPPINPLHGRTLKDHVVHQIQRHRFRRYPQQRRSTSSSQRPKALLDRAGIPGHFQQHVHARFIRLGRDARHRIDLRRVEHHVRSHFGRHSPPLFVRLRGEHRGAPASLSHRNGHKPNRPAAGHQYRLPRNGPRQHGMHRVSQRIENRPVMLRNGRIELPDVRRRNLHKFRKRSILIDPDNPQVLANVRFAQPALVAMPAVHVHFRAHEVPGLQLFDFLPDAFHNAAKFMPQRNRRLDPTLRPAIPPIDVQIRPANGSRTHAHQHVRRSNGWNIRSLKRKTPRGLHFPQGFHRRRHAGDHLAGTHSGAKLQC